MSKTTIRMGMIGGGPKGFIGNVHRMAARLNPQIELCCGAFSSSPERSQAFGRELSIDASRCYADYEEMLRKESSLPEDQRVHFIAITTPNHLHFPVAKAALQAGFHVLSDKPACLRLSEAQELKDLVDASGLKYGLTHNYTGYPMIKEARDLIRRGTLGKLRKIVVEYPQGWLAKPLEQSGQKQASWRTDPAKAGMAGCVGDIGTHAENLAEYVTGLKIHELAADLTTFVPQRALDDDASILLRFEGGAKGILHASQIAVGEENSLQIRVYGETGGLEWRQLEPNSLLLHQIGEPTRILRAGQGYLSEQARSHCFLPPGHPDGFLEAFANIYRNFSNDIAAEITGETPPPNANDYPKIEDGIRGMAFIEAVVKSSQGNASWTSLNL